MPATPPRILVTGASGLLGANLCLVARDRGLAVTAAALSHPVRFDGAESAIAELTDEAATRALVERAEPDVVIHCAAASNVDWCERNPDAARAQNVDATRHVAAACRDAGARLVYISTDSVFDGSRPLWSEDDPPAPINVYARSKLAGEHVALDLLGDRALVVRTTFYGWNAQPKASLAEWILARLESGQRVPGWGDVFFTPAPATDLAGAILDAVDRSLGGVYHICGGERLNKYDFARAVAEAFSLDPALVDRTALADAQLPAARPPDLSLRTDKIAAALGRPMPAIRDGLARFRAERESGHAATLRRAAS